MTATVDYVSKVHTAVLSVTMLFTEDLNMTLTSAFTQSEAKMEEIGLGGPTTFRDDENDAGQIYYTRDYDYDFSELNTYSDISVQEIDVSLDLSYRISEHLRLSGNYTYLFYSDKELYLYDGSGDAHLGTVSMSYIL